MRPRHLTILQFLAWAAVALSGVTATSRASQLMPPSEYATPSPDGRFLFVMIPPGTTETDTRGWNEQEVAAMRAIRKAYPRSGLYRNDGTATPLWTVDWHAYSVDVASDGIHLVRRGRWASRVGEEAFSFFANGRLLRTYVISDLVDFESFCDHGGSRISWSTGRRLDDATGRYAVGTRDGNSFVFDLTTGNIVEERRGIRFWTARIAAALLLAGLTALALRRRRRQGPARAPSTPS